MGRLKPLLTMLAVTGAIVGGGAAIASAATTTNSATGTTTTPSQTNHAAIPQHGSRSHHCP